MSTRSTRRPQVQPLLSPLESLLLAQAAWQLGAGSNSWSAIAKLLSKHPLLSRPKPFFTAQSCYAMYQQLMKDAELDLSDSNDNPHAPINLKLAEKYYRSRHTELRELILAEESKFKTILKEIEDIQAGLWDKKIQAELSGEPETLTELPKEENLEKAQPSDEVFDGSELSGVSESAESSSSSQMKDETHTPIDKLVQNELQEVAAPPTGPQQDVTPATDSLPSPPITIMSIGPTETVARDEDMVSVPEEVLTSIPRISPATPKDDIDVIPMAVDSTGNMVEETVDLQQNDDIHMEDRALEVNQPLDTEVHIESVEQHKDQKQEEEEEETNQDDSTKEEEEEASQSQPEDIEIDTDHGKEETQSSPKLSEEVEDIEDLGRAPTPAAEAAISEPEPIAEEDQSSASEEEPIVPARRSTRRRKSSVASVPLPTTRKRLRSRARLSESEPQAVMDSENEDEEDVKDEETPQPEDDPSSPFDGAMTRRREGKRKASFMDSVDSPIDKKRMREDSEPVDEDEPGPSSHNTRARITRHGTRTEEQVALKRFQNVIGMLHSQISQHRNGTIFHNPIKNSEAPDYHEIVKRPMDLKTIKTRVKDGLIANSLEFQRDIFLMFANSMMYNRPGSDVYAMAEDMMLESEGQITAFRQTEGLVKRGQRQS